MQNMQLRERCICRFREAAAAHPEIAEVGNDTLKKPVSLIDEIGVRGCYIQVRTIHAAQWTVKILPERKKLEIF